ncbi:hypothetical protein KAF44_25795 (plasmid) [Cupriavidus necator]|nr:hypothetical protein KAF44_25795 [Cupriavidus necator]
MSNALNALSKWPGEDEARDAALRLAGRVSSEPQLCQSMEAGGGHRAQCALEVAGRRRGPRRRAAAGRAR